MGDKYKLIPEGAMYRIVATREIHIDNTRYVPQGRKGGLVESEDNLSQDGECWVDKDAVVRGKARVSGNALITGNAIVCGWSAVGGNAIVGDDCQVSHHAVIRGNVVLKGKVWVTGYIELGLREGLINSRGEKSIDTEVTYKDGELTLSRYIPYRTVANYRGFRVRLQTKKGKKGSKPVTYAVVGFDANAKNHVAK